jgi:predicted CopG family antitoxin
MNEHLTEISIQDLFESIDAEGYSFARLINLYREWKKQREISFFQSKMGRKPKTEVIKLFAKEKFCA